MFSKKGTQAKQGKLDTLIGKESYFNGKLSVQGTLRVDGKIEGDISIDGCLVVGKTGHIEGTVSGVNAIVSGEVNGNIHMKEKLELYETAKVVGDISVANFIIHEGAVFRGQSQMTKDNKVDFKKSDEKAKVG